MNRLKLDFSIPDAVGRKEFLDKYLQADTFKYIPLNAEEVEMCGNYLLWGKDANGQNVVQRKEVEISTKNGIWQKKEVESLDALMESPTFNENLIMQPTEARIKVVKENFSRSKALKEAPDSMVPIFKKLFQDIDETDLLINYYELLHNKRKAEPRESLLKAISEEKQEQLKERAKHINIYQFSKLRHQLVELRRQQYSLRDSYITIIQTDPMKKTVLPSEKLLFDVDIEVLPFGIKNSQSFVNKIFSDFETLIPQNFSEKELEKIILSYWSRQHQTTKNCFDFRNPDHIYNVIMQLSEIEIDIDNPQLEDTLKNFYETFIFYMKNADLTDCQREILDLKIRHVKNADIAEYINKKYNKSYTVNYISTIFRQKIIKKISECVTYHQEIVLNLPFPEEFKQCSCCKKYYLRDPRNFVKKTRAKDGYTGRCKNCDKIQRQIKGGK